MAESGTGKDHPRRLNREDLGLAGVKIEGPEDRGDSGPAQRARGDPEPLLQFDEIGRLLKVASEATARRRTTFTAYGPNY